MDSVENLRNVINERLTAAAEEILGIFAQTVSAYEEEIYRQRKLLDVVLRPEIKLHRTELPQQDVCKDEDVLADQQLCIQERNSSLDQEDPEPPQIKEEQEELCTSQEGDQLALKQEITYEEDWTPLLAPDQNESAAQTEPPDNISPKRTKSESDRESVGGPEQNTDHQLIFHNFHVADNRDPTIAISHGNGLHWLKHQGTKLSDKPFKCNSCSKDFYLFTHLKIHMTTHTAEKPFSCTVCGKGFSFKRNLKRHMITHSGEKPYACSQCQRTFRRFEHLKVHIRSHTGERPYSCVYCEKALSSSSALTKHVRLHTGEKP